MVIRKLLAIAVSGITYLRGLFPEKAYGKKYVEGVLTRRSSFKVRRGSFDEEALIIQESVSSTDQKVMILREEGSCPGTSQIVQW